MSLLEPINTMQAGYVTVSNIIIDDIVLYDGRTSMGILGGAGSHALSGMRVWTDQLGIVASVGSDFLQSHKDQLVRLGVDLEGLIIRKEQRTARSWQIFEIDDRRTEISRVDSRKIPGYSISLSEIPTSYFKACGFHILLDESHRLFHAILMKLREMNPTAKVIWEPGSLGFLEKPVNLETFLRMVDVFSPNIEEARKITGCSDIEEIVKVMFSFGVRALAIRMGKAGSLVYMDVNRGWRIPAIADKVVDVTGAGNAYCGGFLVGLGKGLDLADAALHGAVSASFEIEQFGIPQEFGLEMSREAQKRLDSARKRVEII